MSTGCTRTRRKSRPLGSWRYLRTLVVSDVCWGSAATTGVTTRSPSHATRVRSLGYCRRTRRLGSMLSLCGGRPSKRSSSSLPVHWLTRSRWSSRTGHCRSRCARMQASWVSRRCSLSWYPALIAAACWRWLHARPLARSETTTLASWKWAAPCGRCSTFERGCYTATSTSKRTTPTPDGYWTMVWTSITASCSAGRRR